MNHLEGQDILCSVRCESDGELYVFYTNGTFRSTSWDDDEKSNPWKLVKHRDERGYVLYYQYEDSTEWRTDTHDDNKPNMMALDQEIIKQILAARAIEKILK